MNIEEIEKEDSKYCPNLHASGKKLVVDIHKDKMVCPICEYSRELTTDEREFEKEKIKNAMKNFKDAANKRVLEVMEKNGSFMTPEEFIDFHVDYIVGTVRQEYDAEQERKRIKHHCSVIKSYLESIVIESYKAGWQESRCLLGEGKSLELSKELAYILNRWKESIKDD